MAEAARTSDRAAGRDRAAFRPPGRDARGRRPPGRADPPQRRQSLPPRYRTAGGKSDTGDAYLLADILRTDGHRFAPLRPAADEINLVRGRDDLLATGIALANELRALLDGFWPGAAAVFAAIYSPIALAFLARYATPDSAARLGLKRMQVSLAQHRYAGRRSARELLERLRSAPAGLAGKAESDAIAAW